MKQSTCTFLGITPEKLPFGFNDEDPQCKDLRLVLSGEIKKEIEEERVTHFISGMAMGVDMYAAEAVLEMKKDYPEITLECAFPWETQAEHWSEDHRDRYYDIAAHCDKETMLQGHFTPDCIDKVHRYMIDQSDILLAVWNGDADEIAAAIAYGKKQGKRIKIMDPNTLKIAE